MPRPWRLLLDAGGTGPWNMAVDELLLESATRSGTATLRFYRWDGPWLSLGYRQRLEAGRLAACEQAGVGVVRRVTGGRAVLHGGDLTYAVAAPESLLPAGLAATYGIVAEALERALRGLGVAAEPAARPASSAPEGSFDCFVQPAADELCVGGRKLVGSAQRRAGGGVLQHGSIRVTPDPEEARRASGLETGAATSLAELGVGRSVDELIVAARDAFCACLGADFELSSLSADERSEVLARSRERGSELPISVGESPQGPSRVHLGSR